MLVYQAFRYELAVTPAQRAVLAKPRWSGSVGVELGTICPAEGVAAPW